MAKNFSYSDYGLSSGTFSLWTLPYTAETASKIQNGATQSAPIITYQSSITQTNTATAGVIYGQLFDNTHSGLYIAFSPIPTFYIHNALSLPFYYCKDYIEITLTMLLLPIVTFDQLSFASANLAEIRNSDDILPYYRASNLSNLDIDDEPLSGGFMTSNKELVLNNSYSSLSLSEYF
jgi:hypothetical protein